ncbi:MAG: hypothetical protein IPN67_01565 [Bacteroidales bacterium]|nr:hypothetical protein [Bacteroidales bacterium]
MPTLTTPLGFGDQVKYSAPGAIEIYLKDWQRLLRFETFLERRLNIDHLNCTVLGTETDGNPAFLMSQYGKGKIYLLTFPIESNLATTTGAFDKGMPSWCSFYRLIAKDVISGRILTQSNSYIGSTEHNISDIEKVIVMINYDSDDAKTELVIKDGWKISDCLYGKKPSGNSFTLGANDAVVLVVKK